MQNETGTIDVVDLGVCRYSDAWVKQQEIHAEVVAGRARNTVLLVEHPAVVTFGKHAKADNLLVSRSDLERAGIDVVETDRGGEVTGHEPGQMVVYPILRLNDFRLTPRKYVCLLEKAVIATLARYGIEGGTDPDNPGVWIGSRKICAIGIRIKDRATMHGIAFNICNDLRVFSTMVPCGITGRSVTSLAQETGKLLTLADVKPAFVAALLESLEKNISCASASTLPS